MVPDEVVDELYGVAPDEFVSTRTRLARSARESGDRDLAAAVTALRKPTLAAWAVNQLVRERPVEVDRLLDVGRRMRAAQSELDVAAMRELRRERESTLDTFTRATRFVADARGHGLSLAGDAAVRATAVAALADETAAAALAGGALVRTLDYAGFGEVDLSDAVAAEIGAHRDRRGAPVADDVSNDPAAPAAGGRRATAARTTPESEAAHRRRLAGLEDDLARADQELARASLVQAEQDRLREKAARRVDDLTGLLENARRELAELDEAAGEARRERDEAAAAHEQARLRLERAHAPG